MSGHRSDAPFRFEADERQQLASLLARYGETLRHLTIAIDGPAGSGKSTTARRLAAQLHLQHLDTGAMYRALTLVALRQKANCQDEKAMATLLESLPINFENSTEGAKVFIEQEDVTKAIRQQDVTNAVSAISALPEVRRQMVLRQRRISETGGTVMEGRDIGTVVMPHADIKVFLVAEARVRAERRQLEEKKSGLDRPVEEIETEIEKRDHADATRASAPMRQAEDAVLLDTSHIDLAEQVDAILAMAMRHIRTVQLNPRFRSTTGLVETRISDWTQPGWRRFSSGFYAFAHRPLHSVLNAWYGIQHFGRFDQKFGGSVLVACNHISSLDPPLVGSSLPFQASFIAKEELFRIPLFSSLIRQLRAIPIRRGMADYEALDYAVELLRDGCSVLMYPEGTRQLPGQLGRPRWGFGYVAAKAGRPVLPVFLRGTRNRRPRLLRRRPIEVWMGEAVDVSRVLGDDDKDTYHRIGNAVMQRIAGLQLRSAGRHPLPELDLPAAARLDTPPDD
jgi:cytidylate kinase